VKVHELKCWPESFEAIVWNRKKHEVRNNDRGYECGDLLLLRCWDPASESYNGLWALAEVTYVQRAGEGPAGSLLTADAVVMSIRLVRLEYPVSSS